MLNVVSARGTVRTWSRSTSL